MEKYFKYKRIIILGGSCLGKSTLANKISLFTGFTVYHLDALFLDSNWGKKNLVDLFEISNNILLKEDGIIEGNYTDVLFEKRIKWADLIIFIDVKTVTHLFRMIYRIINIKLGNDKRYGSPDGTESEFSLSFLYWVLNWNKKQRRKVFSLLNLAKDKKVLIIKNPKDLDLDNLLK
jgi:adenylate kinase family enzyme